MIQPSRFDAISAAAYCGNIDGNGRTNNDEAQSERNHDFYQGKSSLLFHSQYSHQEQLYPGKVVEQIRTLPIVLACTLTL